MHKQAMAMHKQAAIAEQGQLTERFTRAIDQLGAADENGEPKLEIRLGAIYALERIARDSERDHWSVMEILTAYVRENTRSKATEPVAGEEPKAGELRLTFNPPRIDIQAILTVLGRRERSQAREGERRLVLSRAHLEGVDLRGAHLEGANLGGAHLEGANLEEAYLENAYLQEAHLEKAKLNNAHLGKANLMGAHLENAFLLEAHLEKANLSYAHLEGAGLTGAHLENADLTVANLENAHLSEADLRNAHHLYQNQIDSARFNNDMKLPAGLHMPKLWR